MRLSAEGGWWVYPGFLSELCAAQLTFCTTCYNPTSGPAVRYLNVSMELWKCKPRLRIGNLGYVIHICLFQEHISFYGFRKSLSFRNLLILNGILWPKKIICFENLVASEWVSLLGESMKVRLSLCEMISNHLLTSCR